VGSGAQSEIFRGVDYRPCDIAVIFGLPKLSMEGRRNLRKEVRVRNTVFREHRGTIIYIEAPLLGRSVSRKRKRSLLARAIFPTNASYTRWLLPERMYRDQVHSHFRIGVGGAFNDDGGFSLFAAHPDRWEILKADLNLEEPKPYRRRGDHILVIGQVQGDASLRGADIVEWLLKTCREIAAISDRPLLLRPHPFMSEAAVEHLKRELSHIPTLCMDDGKQGIREVLANAWVTVTASSGAGIESLLEGVPVIATSPASPVYSVADHDIASVLEPTLYERKEWLNKIAACQWSDGEFYDGSVWSALSRLLELS
jgi:hypothetical protein